MKTLEEYLKEQPVIDHALRATVSETGIVRFYIHPNANGETLDFYVLGNMLIPAQVNNAIVPLREAVAEHLKQYQNGDNQFGCPACAQDLSGCLYEKPWFRALRGGRSPDTQHGPGDSWVEGVQLCPHCGHVWEIQG